MLQVTLLPSAVSVDGSGLSASVTAAGGNKAKMKQGTAVFKDVKLSADQAGSYSLRAKPSSRKVCTPGIHVSACNQHQCLHNLQMWLAC